MQINESDRIILHCIADFLQTNQWMNFHKYLFRYIEFNLVSDHEGEDTSVLSFEPPVPLPTRHFVPSEVPAQAAPTRTEDTAMFVGAFALRYCGLQREINDLLDLPHKDWDFSSVKILEDRGRKDMVAEILPYEICRLREILRPEQREETWYNTTRKTVFLQVGL